MRPSGPRDASASSATRTTKSMYGRISCPRPAPFGNTTYCSM
ncbi:hypothetical protein DB32_008679 [Sandaracinus amylolyticus]|uniref:Uncharacterized protein n=1 Tax=Sandaracinus amylolyticus TaxID=927083 RepID=A0A0F6WAF5_9BACT|nr:hypothetical protein DB32_008679 [Sandaracinus amylolyticus]